MVTAAGPPSLYGATVGLSDIALGLAPPGIQQTGLVPDPTLDSIAGLNASMRGVSFTGSGNNGEGVSIDAGGAGGTTSGSSGFGSPSGEA
jgi:hypothetical protein